MMSLFENNKIFAIFTFTKQNKNIKFQLCIFIFKNINLDYS
jgi:hypothetical protein